MINWQSKGKLFIIFIAICIAVKLFVQIASHDVWRTTSLIIRRYFYNQSRLEEVEERPGNQSELMLYHHVIDQLQWIAAYSKNGVDFISTNPPTIYYDRVHIYHPTDPDGCHYKCIFTNNTRVLRNGDAAVFSNPFNAHEARRLKNLGVLIAFETGESPKHAPYLGQSQASQVDLFITYVAKSPVPYLYPMFFRNTRPKYKFTAEEIKTMTDRKYTHLLPKYHQKRSKLIAWVVSNFSPANNRGQFATAINEFIPVDIYGYRQKSIPDGEDAFKFLSNNYKFYLSFENSNCRNYITEKVSRNALQYDMIPIVLGAFKEDYEGALPPHSYINVDDFTSIRELTDYIRYLDKNDTAYASYLAWKEHGKIYDFQRLDCRLCGYLHQLNEGKIKLPKLDPRDFVDPNTLCFERPLLPKI